MPGFLTQLLQSLLRAPAAPALNWPLAIRLAPAIKQAMAADVARAVEAAYFLGAKDGVLIGLATGVALGLAAWARAAAARKS